MDIFLVILGTICLIASFVLIAVSPVAMIGGIGLSIITYSFASVIYYLKQINKSLKELKK